MLQSVFNPVNPTFDLVRMLEVLFDIALEYCGEHDKSGGHFLLALETGAPFTLQRVDIKGLTEERAAATREYAQEKVNRLLEHESHCASRLSRDPDQKKWGGAIRINGGFMSFSGLPEYADEALCLRLAVLFELLPSDRAVAIAQTTKNPFFAMSVVDLDRQMFL